MKSKPAGALALKTKLSTPNQPIDESSPFANEPWIFVSYSNHDLAKARLIRNRLEELQSEPILFFLKGLSPADEPELKALIHKEIEARDFFLLLDSHSAQASRWVQEENAYREAQKKTLFLKLDLDSFALENEAGHAELPCSISNAISERVMTLKGLMTIYPLYAPGDDAGLVKRFRQALAKHGIRLSDYDGETDLLQTDLLPGSFFDQISSIIAASKIALCFITPGFLHSRFCQQDLHQAERYRKNIIPIFVDAIQRDPLFQKEFPSLALRQGFHYDSSNPEASVTAIIQDLIRWLFA
jgi:hypothetical protein